MNIEEILAEWERDSFIDQTTILSASLQSSKLHHKYITFYTREKLAVIQRKAELAELENDVREYYLGQATQQILETRGWSQYQGRAIPRTSLSEFVDRHPDVIKTRMQLEVREEKVNLLYDILKVIHNRSFHINNVINYLKWKDAVGG